MELGQQDIHMEGEKKKNLDPYLTPYIKIRSRCKAKRKKINLT